MHKNLAFLVLALLLFTQCTQEKSEIRVVCEATPPGHYLIKWETFPLMEGTVKIYESSHPDSFNLNSPIAETKINKGFIKDIFFVKPAKRSYFKLIFNKKHTIVTAERTIPMQGLFNFRDLGGYYNVNRRQTRWGKLYRSSSLERASFQDGKVLNNLGIRTVIDFRTDKERNDSPSKYIAPQVFNFPLHGNPYNVYFDRILAKTVRAGDIKIFAQDMFAYLLENNSDYYIKMFDILLDSSNYPVLVHCSLGSERSAIASALILAALDIDTDQIISDYMLTNEKLDYDLIVPWGNIFLKDQEVEETLTAQYRVHKGSITYSFDRIIKKFGTIDNYLSIELKLTPRKREKLKEIMLY